MANHNLQATVQDVEKDLRINTVRKPLSRRCSQCGKGYFRRNLVEMWTTRNEGRRYGWHKEIGKICLDCQATEESKRIIGIADIQFGRIVKLGGGRR